MDSQKVTNTDEFILQSTPEEADVFGVTSEPDSNADKHKIMEISFRLTKYRYLFLILANLLRFGRNYAYDNPQALQNVLTDPKGNFALSNFNYNLLYGVYSFPNIILPFMAGLIIDKLGSRLGILLFSFVIIIGQFFFFLGGIIASFPLMIVGRVIFGLGGETLVVTQNTVLAKWFGDKELAFALAMDIAVARIGGTLNTVLTPFFYSETNGYFVPLFVGLVLCIFSWFCGVAMCYMDKKADKMEGIIYEKSGENINLSVVKKFNFAFWMLVINCAMIYGSFFGFCGNGNDILIKLFGLTANNAGILLMIFYLSSALATPLFGIWADKYGKRASTMLIMIVIFILSLLFLIYIPSDYSANIVILPMILIGLFYAIWATLFFPSIALVVRKDTVGTAFGLNNSIENLNLSISPLIFGLIHDNTQRKEGYFWSFMFLIAQAMIGLFTMVVVYAHNHLKGGKLEKPMSNVKLSNSAISSF